MSGQEHTIPLTERLAIIASCAIIAWICVLIVFGCPILVAILRWWK
jgi:hypothetical protein